MNWPPGEPHDVTFRISRLSDMAVVPAQVVRWDDNVGGLQVTHSSWFVIVDGDDDVVAAVPAEELADLPATGSVWDAVPSAYETVVADADCSVVSMLSSSAFRDAVWPIAVVLRAGAAVIGVWAGPDLADVLEFGTTRVGIDHTMSGRITVPIVVKHCAFRDEHGRRCNTLMRFHERPLRPDRCANPYGLPEHPFAWESPC